MCSDVGTEVVVETGLAFDFGPMASSIRWLIFNAWREQASKYVWARIAAENLSCVPTFVDVPSGAAVCAQHMEYIKNSFKNSNKKIMKNQLKNQ